MLTQLSEEAKLHLEGMKRLAEDYLLPPLVAVQLQIYQHYSEVYSTYLPVGVDKDFDNWNVLADYEKGELAQVSLDDYLPTTDEDNDEDDDAAPFYRFLNRQQGVANALKDEFDKQYGNCTVRGYLVWERSTDRCRFVGSVDVTLTQPIHTAPLSTT